MQHSFLTSTSFCLTSQILYVISMFKSTCSFFFHSHFLLFYPFFFVLLFICHFTLLCLPLLLSSSFCGKLSLNELQIKFKCSQRHFQLFQTVILLGKLLSTHAHTDADCSVWQSIKSLWHLRCCTVIILRWIISLSRFLLQDRAKERHRDWHISSCNVRLQCQRVSSRVSESY